MFICNATSFWNKLLTELILNMNTEALQMWTESEMMTSHSSQDILKVSACVFILLLLLLLLYFVLIIHLPHKP